MTQTTAFAVAVNVAARGAKYNKANSPKLPPASRRKNTLPPCCLHFAPFPSSIVPRALAEDITLGRRDFLTVVVHSRLYSRNGALLGTGSALGLGNLKAARLDDVEVVGL